MGTASESLQLRLPSWATTITGIVLGVLAALNTSTFHFGSPWTNGIQTALIVGAAFGIGPLLGTAWRAALHLTTQETAIVTAIITAVSLWLKTESLGTDTLAVINGVLVVLSTLGFGVGAVVVTQGLRRVRRTIAPVATLALVLILLLV